MKKSILLLAIGLLTFASCKKETIEPNPEPTPNVTVSEPTAMNLQVFVKDESMGFGSYDFKVVMKSPTESIDSLNTTVSNFSDGVSTINYATLQCDVDTNLVYSIDVYDDSDNLLLTLPVDFFLEDGYIFVTDDNSITTVTGEVTNHDDIENLPSDEAHVIVGIGI